MSFYSAARFQRFGAASSGALADSVTAAAATASSAANTLKAAEAAWFSAGQRITVARAWRDALAKVSVNWLDTYKPKGDPEEQKAYNEFGPLIHAPEVLESRVFSAQQQVFTEVNNAEAAQAQAKAVIPGYEAAANSTKTKWQALVRQYDAAVKAEKELAEAVAAASTPAAIQAAATVQREEKSKKTMLIVAGVALPLLGIVVLALTRKKSPVSVAGYRRRHTRRRSHR